MVKVVWLTRRCLERHLLLSKLVLKIHGVDIADDVFHHVLLVVLSLRGLW